MKSLSTCRGMMINWGLYADIIVYGKLPPSPVSLWIELGGKSKWLPLNFGYNCVMRTTPIELRTEKKIWLCTEGRLTQEQWVSVVLLNIYKFPLFLEANSFTETQTTPNRKPSIHPERSIDTRNQASECSVNAPCRNFSVLKLVKIIQGVLA